MQISKLSDSERGREGRRWEEMEEDEGWKGGGEGGGRTNTEVEN